MMWFRREYRLAVERMDLILVNSENVRQRLLNYLQLSAVVVYPPVATERFTWRGDDGYYLSVARLEPNKRVDIVIRAFLAMPQRKLVVASGGSEFKRLKYLAQGAPNIQFVGWQSEEALSELVGWARAVVYLPVDEDFGMSPVEAMAAGKPVIGVAEGGLLETVQHGVTGWLIQPAPTAAGVQQAVRSLESLNASKLRVACEERAKEFSEQRFLDVMAEWLPQAGR
jgi:glycosyltransferase involved in cell wall biosynthesis